MASAASSDVGRVRADAFVSIAYELYDDDGRLVDAVHADEPLSFVHGYAAIIPGLDSGLEGAVVGERRTLELGPEQAFGEHDRAGVLEVDHEELAGELAVGDEVTAVSPDGVEVVWRVTALDGDVVLVDTNHPLAGARVRFEVTICAVRPATEQEIEAAQADLDQRIVGDGIVGEGSIGYQSDPTHETQPGPDGLIQLRRGPLQGGDEDKS